MAADPRRISTRARKACNEAAPDRIGGGGEHNGYRPRFSQQCCNIGRTAGDNDIACKGDKIFGVNSFRAYEGDRTEHGHGRLVPGEK